MDIQCVFSDLDRTLLNKEGRISQKNRETIEDLIKEGICFVPVTGRAYASLPKDIFEIEGIKHCITSNGTAICELQDGRPVIKKCLPKGFLKEFKKYFRTLGECGLEFYFNGRAYTTKEFYEDPAAFNQNRVEYVRSTRTPVDDLWAFGESRDGEIDAVCIISPKGRFEELCVKTRETLSGVYITNSDSLYIEISNMECGKKNAMLDFCSLMHYDVRKCVAFGDNDNDHEMLKEAGIGVCVANGTEKSLEAADLVVASHDEDGFAEGIEKIRKGWQRG